MQHAALRKQEPLVNDLAREGMAECICRSAYVAGLQGELVFDTLTNVPRQVGLRDLAYSAEQIEPEVHSDHRRGGERRLGLGRELLDARDEHLTN